MYAAMGCPQFHTSTSKILKSLSGKVYLYEGRPWPEEHKYRRLDIDNASLAQNVWDVPGGRDVCEALGWRFAHEQGPEPDLGGALNAVLNAVSGEGGSTQPLRRHIIYLPDE